MVEQTTVIRRGSQAYPASLSAATEVGNFTELWAAGPIDVVASQTMSFFCSSQCPGSIVLKTFDAITKMRDEGQVLMGGFHSVMEWECLRILLRGRQPVIWVPARSIAGMRLKPELQSAFKDGRLLILSPFAPTPANTRVTAALAQQRNRFVGALADRIFVPHAAPGSRTLALCGELHRAGKRLITVPDPLNGPLERLDAEYFESGTTSVTGAKP